MDLKARIRGARDAFRGEMEALREDLEAQKRTRDELEHVCERLQYKLNLAQRQKQQLEQEVAGRWPMNRKHFIIFPKLRLAYCRVPKVANTSIKTALADTLELAHPKLAPTNDAFWRRRSGGIDLVQAEELILSCQGYFTFAFVREPRDRLLSFYNANIRRWNLSPALADLGFSKDMSLEDFVDRVCEISDEKADIHFLPQSQILGFRGLSIPSFIGRYDRLGRDWERLRAIVKSLRDFHLPELGWMNKVDRAKDDGAEVFSPRISEKIRYRYSRDYELYFDDV